VYQQQIFGNQWNDILSIEVYRQIAAVEIKCSAQTGLQVAISAAPLPMTSFGGCFNPSKS
jgi:hypothetical protein